MTTTPTSALPSPAPTPDPPRADVASVLLTVGTGKTGRRVAARLEALGVHVRSGSRSGPPAAAPPSGSGAAVRFDWTDRTTWAPALAGVDAAYLCFVPDLAVDGAPEAVAAFADEAVRAGVRRVVLLSGRGEPEAQRAELEVRRDGLAWTVVRCAWFAQNLSEGFLVDAVRAGELALPVTTVREPWVDLEDVADVVVAALTGPDHAGRTYDVTGPRLVTFPELMAEVSRGLGREVGFRTCTLGELQAGLRPYGDDVVDLLTYLVTEVLDGRNERLGHGVRRALGREPRHVADYVAATAPTGVWDVR
ncbi:SDR family oxidoreductase [Actinotalea solisilvae]|uniref:SDR family oxidoreductase n=1 Tax=Actinotalea solisilvae TaxID=2072922 RepID=UPI0018F16EB9|nr:NAD(P)H-binding protein [Actinotalea solisilvae]